MEVMEGRPVDIQEIVSYEGLYAEVVDVNERVGAQGKCGKHRWVRSSTGHWQDQPAGWRLSSTRGFESPNKGLPW